MQVRKILFLPLIALISLSFLNACIRSTETDIEPWQPGLGMLTSEPEISKADPFVTDPRPIGQPILTPTPDDPHPIPGMRTEEEQYIVQGGDTLGQISDRFGLTVVQIAEANDIENINILSVGQTLIIPAVQPTVMGPGFKIIPDSELVAGPATASFDAADFIYSKNGYLIRYQEDVDGQMLSGFQIIQQIAMDYSVNPRLLIAMLEYQSGWITNANPRSNTLKYPLGLTDPFRDGLYKQLAWTANNLNRGYYLWRVNAVATWALTDGTVVPVNPTINAGTAAIQYFFSQLYDHKIWERSVYEDGFFAVYSDLFGYPFDYAVESVVPAGMVQPLMQLPFESGVTWAFTGGPHGGWGDGSAWAALDFAPFVDAVGCVSSDYWVTAMSDGLIIRAENGAVVQDLDGDGREQTGWTILYMHVEGRDRVQPGIFLRAGERIGHPSCEGGISNGTHVHIARRYNGEWIPADQDLPFVLDGWTSSGTGNEYDGFLQKGSTTLEAWDRNIPANAIER